MELLMTNSQGVEKCCAFKHKIFIYFVKIIF